jgi:hypothetical protein
MLDTQEYRLYTFINFYLSSIQQGIQTQHVDREQTNKYRATDGTPVEVLNNWSENHKTTIVLNGGDNASMHDHYNFLLNNPLVLGDTTLPFAKFHESESALGGLLTSVAVVLPEQVYDAVPYSRMPVTVQADIGAEYTADELLGAYIWQDPRTGSLVVYLGKSAVAQFLARMKACPLAR